MKKTDIIEKYKTYIHFNEIFLPIHALIYFYCDKSL